MRGLYAILDTSAVERAGLEPIAVAEALLESRPACLQLRAKSLAPRRALELLRELRPLATRRRVPLFANDRPDLALLAQCDGVHVGQHDLAPEDVRLLQRACNDTTGGRPFLVGLSTHDEAQLRKGIESPIDYIAIGPAFPTSSKASPDPVVGAEGVASLARIVRAKRPDLPIVAIGGVNRARALSLVGEVDMVAVIGALLPQEPMPLASALDYVRARALEISALFAREMQTNP